MRQGPTCQHLLHNTAQHAVQRAGLGLQQALATPLSGPWCPLKSNRWHLCTVGINTHQVSATSAGFQRVEHNCPGKRSLDLCKIRHSHSGPAPTHEPTQQSDPPKALLHRAPSSSNGQPAHNCHVESTHMLLGETGVGMRVTQMPGTATHASLLTLVGIGVAGSIVTEPLSTAQVEVCAAWNARVASSQQAGCMCDTAAPNRQKGKDMSQCLVSCRVPTERL